MTVIYNGSPLRDQWVRNAHTHTYRHTHIQQADSLYPIATIVRGSLLPLLFGLSFVCMCEMMMYCVHVLCCTDEPKQVAI